MKRAEGEYSDDAPYVDEDTGIDELLDYAYRRVEDPIEINNCRVYHFSSHVPDHDALSDVTEDLEGDFIVPFQVDTAWSFIWSALPEALKRESDFLIYMAHENRYTKYPNFYKLQNTNFLAEALYKAEMSNCYND